MAALIPLSLPTTQKPLHAFSKFWEEGRLEVRDVKRKMSRRTGQGPAWMELRMVI